MARRAAFAVLLGLLPACGGTTIDPTSYQRGCAADTDCSVVYGGDVCAACLCPNAGIATEDLARFQKDTASMQTHCPANRPPVHCEPCVAMAPFCLDGQCSAHAQ